MIEMLTDYLIKRRLKKDRIHIEQNANTPRDYFKRVLNTLRENRVMVDTRPDGVYIRMAGNVEKGQAFSLDWARVIKFKSDYAQIGKDITYPSSVTIPVGPACKKEIYLVSWLYKPGQGFYIHKFEETFTNLADAQKFKNSLQLRGGVKRAKIETK